MVPTKPRQQSNGSSMNRANNARQRSQPYSRPHRPSGVDGPWVHDLAPGAEPRYTAGSRIQPGAGKLVVSNLHYEVTVPDLVKIFGAIGTLARDPMIRYDRSDRSTGVAIVTYVTAVDAQSAKSQLNGVLALGQPLVIEFEEPVAPPATSKPNTLLDRISKPPLLQRLGGSTNHKRAVSSPAASTPAGPQRNRPRIASAGPRQKPKPKPKTAEDLDKELDVFMRHDKSDASNGGKAGTEGGGNDVEMK